MEGMDGVRRGEPRDLSILYFPSRPPISNLSLALLG